VTTRPAPRRGHRALVAAAACLLMSAACGEAPAPAAAVTGIEETPVYLSRVDHLVYAAPDLDAAVDHLEALIGVRASPGGSHPRWGTRNALVSLGERTYLEVIAPDPALPEPPEPRIFGIDDLQAPKLVTWAANAQDLPAFAAEAGNRGIDLGEVTAGRRETPAGVTLSWMLSSPRAALGDGLVPFFIDWGETPHPAASAAAGVALVEMRAEHPDPTRIGHLLDAVGLDLPVTRGPEPALIAYIATVNGRAELR